MPEENRCPKCSKPLPPGSPRGLCPACLLQCGLEANTAGYTDEAQARAKWTPPGIEQLAPLFPELDILELIGRGGMGAVYKAKQKELDRLVALKILPPEIGRDTSFAQRFAREAQAMAKLGHPNIVTIYSFGQRGELYFFIMEYIDGLSLRQLLDTGTTSPKEALAIVPQICDALQYAHDRGIVHRDIKPENILLNRQGQVKIADFGLAKLVGLVAPGAAAASSAGEAEPGVAQAGATIGGERVMGTPQYMAPEQIDRPGEVDHRADIYSLGVVFYQMLTGELPAGRFEPPSHKVLIDVRLDEVVLRALEKEPARRYQQVSEVKTEVETIVATRPPEPPRPSQPPQANRTIPWSLKEMALVVGLAAAIGAYFVLLASSSGSRLLVTGVIAPVAALLVIFLVVARKLHKERRQPGATPVHSASTNDVEKARRAVKAPAIGMIVLAAIALAAIVIAAVVVAARGYVADHQIREAAGQIMGHWRLKSAVVVPPVLAGLAMNILILLGTIRMIQLRNRGLAAAAAIFLLIECVPLSPGSRFPPIALLCVAGIAFGIWALVVLSRREVIEAFAAARQENVLTKSRALRWLAAIGILISIGLAAWMVWHRSTPFRPMLSLSPPADPQAAQVWHEIQLVGVLPDGGDDILNAEGKPIGRSLGLGPWNWTADSQARTLVFDVPQSPDILWTVFPEVHVSETGRPLGGGMTGWTAEYEGKRRQILALTLARTYQKSGWFGLGTRTVPINRIDVTLKYYLPGRGKAGCTFIGPFEAGKVARCQEGYDCTLTPTGSMWPDGRGTKFHISATDIPVASEIYDRILAYDVQGRQHLLRGGGGSTRGAGNLSSAERDEYIEGLPLAQIAAITLGEEPQSKTFRNIRVRYPDRPVRDYPEYLDKMAAALGLTGSSAEELREYEFKNAEDALKVIDIVRGPHIERAWRKIERTDFASFDRDTRDKIHSTAKLWADNGCCQGIEMGLKGQWSEFVAPALAVLGQDVRFRSEVAYGLQAYRQFTSQELEQIAAILEDRDDPRGMAALLRCLNLNRQRPGGREALLRVARSNKVWLWWPSLQYLTSSGGPTLGQLTRDLQVKYLAQTNPELGLDVAMAAEARTLLVTLPTAKLSAMSTSTLSEAMRSVAKNLPRAEAQAVFLDLLQDMVDHWADYQFGGYSPSKWWAIDRAVRYLNNWNDLNLGGVGQDVNDETSDRGRIDWPALAMEVLERFGRTPATSPVTQAIASVSGETRLRTITLADALGQPIPGATLDLRAAGRGRSKILRPRLLQEGPKIRVRADSKGRFQVAWPIRTDKRRIFTFTGQASHPDYGAAPVTVYAGDRVTRALLVRKGSPEYQRALKGQVVDEAGQPVAGALVESSRALTPGVGGQGNAITDSTGRFVMYFLPRSEDDRNRPLPSNAEYDVVARAPGGMDLFPVRMKGQSPMRLVLRTPTLRSRRLQFEVGDERYAQEEDLDWIRLTWVPPDTRAGGIGLEVRYISDEPVRLIAGQYRAEYFDGHGRSFDYVPVDIAKGSPQVITFRRPPAVTYRGQVVDGITGEPVAGAFVFTYGLVRGNTNLAMLFEQDWRNLEAMPETPSLDDPGVKALNRHVVVESIVRTNAEGRYEVIRGREQRATTLLVFAKDRLPMKVRLSELEADGQRVDVPAIPLFPAAYVEVRPEVPVGARVSVYPQLEYQAEGQPKWFQLFLQAMKDAGFPDWPDMSGPVRIFVPAQINLKLRFQAGPGSSVAPKANEQVLNLSPGETKDIGVLEFLPLSNSTPPPQPAAEGTSAEPAEANPSSGD